MTHETDPFQQASDRYHAHYSDVSYKAIQRAVIADLYEPIDAPGWEDHLDTRLSQPIPNRIMNMVTDAASEICHWPGFQGSLPRLTQELVLQRVSWATIQLITDYLHCFETAGETFSADLCAAVQGMQFALKAETVLHEAVRSASEIHSWQGRAAYDVLIAAEQLVRAAQLLLMKKDDMSYIQEKIKHASAHIASALQEGPLKTSSHT